MPTAIGKRPQFTSSLLRVSSSESRAVVMAVVVMACVMVRLMRGTLRLATELELVFEADTTTRHEQELAINC